MGYICEYCGEQRSIVYCRSDAACLCLSCDRNVHSANALSQRHSRTLICERCNSQPAVVRCVEERTSLCQNCDWSGHASSSSGSSMHKRQALSCYTGCPSAAELSNIWSFLLDDPSIGDTCEQRMGSMSINDNRPRDGQDPQGKDNSQNVCAAVEVNDMNISEKSDLLVESSMPTFDNKLHNVEPPIGSSSKGCYMGAKGSSLFEEDPYCDNLIMDAVDLSIENYEELFGDSLNYPDELFENENLDSFFGMKDIKGVDYSNRGVNAAEGSSNWRVNTVQPTCSDAASADSMMSCKTDSILYFARQSSLSVSNQTGGECSAGDHQDCGVSPMLLMGEPPWCPPCTEISSTSTSRSNAVLRYKEKKKTRKFDKRVRYVSRKARADVRRRVKGRFIKAGDAYDYDPLPTRSY
ncbi:zinc finger protein CONSTANS-LIKE 9-like [Solanum stenotomum]|uniref:zinc finger protein CONSTANS-LIKE 9-like n=1 Tax=Solanum stenotomum TaxID=172797 RepID=UPI0020D03F92|nr:zinc finger protein CONSTANS-LIKE 9-like [Solanum stenotomum]XP_049398086.1 zinc finger protein CONSTANS-LIKE 9-like [Solanum stenotomum]XP_049398087.1 zinc finger protein CONSTANS-LIKE 9-like [Solanum stenotomum]